MEAAEHFGELAKLVVERAKVTRRQVKLVARELGVLVGFRERGSSGVG